MRIKFQSLSFGLLFRSLALLLFLRACATYRSLGVGLIPGHSRKSLQRFFQSTTEQEISQIYRSFNENKDTKRLIEALDQLKAQNMLNLWSEVKDERWVPNQFFLSPNNDPTKRKLRKIRNQITLPTKKIYQFAVLSSVLILLIWFGLLANNPQLSQSSKNVFGLVALSYPFLISALTFAIPDFILLIYDRVQSLFIMQPKRNSHLLEDDRSFYHEAAHFLVAYLMGIPIINYRIYPQASIELAISSNIPASIEERKGYVNLPMLIERLKLEEISQLLPISLAGIIMESQRYPEVKGGLEDYTLALLLIKRLGLITKKNEIQSNQSMNTNDVEEYFAAAYRQGEKLLFHYQDKIDKIVIGMKAEYSIPKIINLIEGIP